MNPGAMAFNKDFFKQQNQKLKDNSFPDLEDGLMNATLVDTSMNHSKNSGRLQATFQWKIDADESKNAGRLAFSHIGLTDAQGLPAEGGYTAFAISMRKLGLTNEEAVAEDPQGALQAVIGSKARISIETKDEFQNIRVKKLLYSPLTDGAVEPSPEPASGGNGVHTPQTTAVAAPEPEPESTVPDNAAAYGHEKFTNDGTVEVKEGMKVIYRAKDGQYSCIVETELEDSDQILLRRENGGKTFLAKRSDCFFVVVDEEIKNPVTPEIEPEIEPEPVSEEPIVLEPGMNVRGKYKGEVITGKVKKIDEAQELVWITMGQSSYPCKFDTIEVIK